MTTTSSSWPEQRDQLPATTRTPAQPVARQHSSGEIGLVVAGPSIAARSASATLQTRIRVALAMPDLRQDVSARLEAFRSRQQALRVERETHYQDAIERIRSVTAGWTPCETESRPAAAEAPAVQPAAEVDGGWERIWFSIVQVADSAPSDHPKD